MPYLAKILLYPIKSLDGVEVEQGKILPSGALEGDRQFAIFDENGRVVNGKRYPQIHQLRSLFNISQGTISLQIPGHDCEYTFHLQEQQQVLASFLSDFFGFPVTLKQNLVVGFPDDLNASGPTIISTATLTEVASWFPGVTVDEMRRRIRANLEIAGVPEFWEDRLFSESGAGVAFKVGNVEFLGINPCHRCVVPTRDSLTGELYPNFQKIFVQRRQATLPDGVAVSRFKSFYSLSLNTQLPTTEAGKAITVGEQIAIAT